MLAVARASAALPLMQAHCGTSRVTVGSEQAFRQMPSFSGLLADWKTARRAHWDGETEGGLGASLSHLSWQAQPPPFK